MSNPQNSPKRLALLEAAGRLFRAFGFRAVTMEGVAAEAKVAKATLYSHFPDKNALFAAVADLATHRIRNAMESELAAPGALDERLARALIARHKMTFEVVDGSPHARELMYAKDALAQKLVAVHDEAMRTALAAALREDPVFAKSAAQIATTLFFAAIGVSHHARSFAQIETDIGGFVRPYLLGLRALAKRESDGLGDLNVAQRRPARAGARG